MKKCCKSCIEYCQECKVFVDVLPHKDGMTSDNFYCNFYKKVSDGYEMFSTWEIGQTMNEYKTISYTRNWQMLEFLKTTKLKEQYWQVKDLTAQYLLDRLDEL